MSDGAFDGLQEHRLPFQIGICQVESAYAGALGRVHAVTVGLGGLAQLDQVAVLL